MTSVDENQKLITSLNPDGGFAEVKLPETPKERYSIDEGLMTNLDTSNIEEHEFIKKRQRRCCGDNFIARLFRTFDTHFLLAITFQYFNTGMRVVQVLAFLDLFKNKYKLDPSYEQTLQTIINFPWTPKIFYGIIADTFPICGSRKRSYLIVMGLLQATCSILLALIEF